MIIDLKKFLFIGVKKELDHFFAQAQEMGFIEFIDPDAKRKPPLPKNLQRMVDAIKILRHQTPSKESPSLHLSAEEVTDQILSARYAIDSLEEEERIVEAEMSRVEVLGDFSLDEVAALEEDANKKVQFFCMKTAKKRDVQIPEEVIYVGSAYDLDYFLTVNDEPKKYPDMIELIIEKPIGELRARKQEIMQEIKQREKELSQYAHYLDTLQHAFHQLYDEHALKEAKSSATHPLEQSVFAVEGWVPLNKIAALEKYLNKVAVIAEPIAVDKDERIPTHLENKGVSRLGEDLVSLYDVPADSDKDPSTWVIWSFALFFAMIVSDAGYGLLFLLTGLFFKSRFPRIKGAGKRMIKLTILLATTSIIWGVLVTSFFGVEVTRNHWFAKLSPLHYLAEKKAEFHFNAKDDVYLDIIQQYPQLAGAKSGDQLIEGVVLEPGGSFQTPVLNEFSDTILLEFSLLIGVLHISTAFFRYMRRNWAGIGWVLFMIGGYLYFPKVLVATSLIHVFGVPFEAGAEAGLQLIYAGMGTAIVLALSQRGWKGIGEIASLVSVFADVLSYLRIYALALASAILARTFNEMGIGLGLFFGILVIILGHGINISLGVMGGVIHGLRLNFIEWYHYCFIGGGRLFQPLKRTQGE